MKPHLNGVNSDGTAEDIVNKRGGMRGPYMAGGSDVMNDIAHPKQLKK